MEKLKITGISNHNDVICYFIEKDKKFYRLFSLLLERLNIAVPDFYESSGELIDVLSLSDSFSHYSNGSVTILEVVGQEKVMLFFLGIDGQTLKQHMDEIAIFS